MLTASDTPLLPLPLPTSTTEFAPTGFFPAKKAALANAGALILGVTSICLLTLDSHSSYCGAFGTGALGAAAAATALIFQNQASRGYLQGERQHKLMKFACIFNSTVAVLNFAINGGPALSGFISCVARS